MQKDTGFNEKLVTYLYALEVRACVLTGSELAVRFSVTSYDVISCHLIRSVATSENQSLLLSLLLPITKMCPLPLLFSSLLSLLCLQVQQLVESGDESSLGDVQEAYDIPQEKAELIVEVS
jgi:hypothetical protein